MRTKIKFAAVHIAAYLKVNEYLLECEAMIKVPVSVRIFKSFISRRVVFFTIHCCYILVTLTSVRYRSVLSQLKPIDRQTRPSPLCSWCKELFVSTHRVWVCDNPFLSCCPIAPSNSSFLLRVTTTNHSEQRRVLTKCSNYLFLFHPVCMAPNSPLNNSVRNINFVVSVLLSLFLVVHFSLPKSKFGLIQYLVAHLRSRVHNPRNKSSTSYPVKKSIVV